MRHIGENLRRFVLERAADATGVSGTGLVAEGVRFSDGTVVVRWRGPHATTAVHSGMPSVEAIHLHGGQTRIVWLFDPPETARPPVGEA